MSTRASRVLGGWVFVLLLLSGGLAPLFAAPGQEPGAPQAIEGEIVIPRHWSPYQAPTSYPEGTRLHIIVRGDTLWDLANQYFQNPFLWPQLWDANRYIRNPHLIYPGDPLVIPDLDVLRAAGEEPGVPGAPGELPPGEEGAGEPGVAGVSGPLGPQLFPVSEEVAIQCSDYVSRREDESLFIFGSEEAGAKLSLATGDIVYLNRGSRDGLAAGDRFYVQRRAGRVAHPARWGSVGWHIQRAGWLNVLAVQEDTAIGEIVQACSDVLIGDYLVPFEPIPVPLVPVHDPPHRLTPETGNTRGYIVASLEPVLTLGAGHVVSLDVGEEQGVIPGSLFTIYRYLYDNAPRKVLGEAAILTVQDRTATAKIIYSYDFIDVGDQVELKQ